MSAYFIVHRREISDSESLKDYSDGIDETIREFGGEIVVRDDSFDVLEGDWMPGRKNVDSRPERITVLRFPDMDRLKSWYQSDEYAGLKDIRRSSSSSDIVAVHGRDGV